MLYIRTFMVIIKIFFSSDFQQLFQFKYMVIILLKIIGTWLNILDDDLVINTHVIDVIYYG